MKIAIIGYGKMGQAIDKMAPELGIEVSSRVDPTHEQADFSTLTYESVEEADVCIDFSHPLAVVHNISTLCSFEKQIVVGTTGWESSRKIVEGLVKSAEIGFISGDNFSMGVHLFTEIARAVAKKLISHPEYSLSLTEIHHQKKVDRPSGTALWIERILKEEGISLSDLASVRCGTVPGTHTLLLDGIEDSITITHTARSRNGFARGALKAAEWILPRKGMFTITDMLQESPAVIS